MCSSSRLTRNSLASKPCRAELAYAQALGVPILPVQIGPVDSLRTAPISEIQIVDYRERTSASGISLISAIQDSSAQRRELPDPLPEPPQVPFEYLMRLGSAIEAAQLSPNEQGDLVRQLRECLETEDDDGVLEDARGLLRALRRRPDVTYRNASEIDALLAGSGAGQGAVLVADPDARAEHAPAHEPDQQPVEQPVEQPAEQPAQQPRADGPPPGWYADPSGTGQQRYWDGERWTEHVSGGMRAASPGGPPPARGEAGPAPVRTAASPATNPGRPPGQASSKPFSIAAFVLGGIAILFFPIIFGVAGIVCAGVAKSKQESLANAALAVAIGGTILGFILGAIVQSTS